MNVGKLIRTCGRVLDASALIAFARGTSVYAAAVAAAWAELAEEHQPVLDVLLQLPVMVMDNLDESRARSVGRSWCTAADPHGSTAGPFPGCAGRAAPRVMTARANSGEETGHSH